MQELTEQQAINGTEGMFQIMPSILQNANTECTNTPSGIQPITPHKNLGAAAIPVRIYFSVCLKVEIYYAS